MQRGDLLFRQNQTSSGLFRVISGCVTLRRTGEDGDILTLHRAVAGGYFAEASIYSDAYHCDAICTEAGSVQKFSKTAVLKLMRSDPQISENFTKHMAQQVQHYRAHIEILAIRSAKERVMAAMQAGYFEATAIEIASQINLSHEACYRALKSLCEDGRMKRVGRGQYELV